MRGFSVALAATATLSFADEGRAGDMTKPDAVAREILNTITLEIAPEPNIRATSNQSAGSLNDITFKVAYTRDLGSGWSWTLADEQTARFAGEGRYQNELETTVGYSAKINDTFSLPLSAGVGYIWNTRAASSGLSDHQWAYYVFNAGLNVKLNSKWTWNAVSARYRDAFEGGWKTPRLTTGATYTINPHNAVYANVGYAWKTGVGGAVAPDIGPDKWNITFGYKISY